MDTSRFLIFLIFTLVTETWTQDTNLDDLISTVFNNTGGISGGIAETLPPFPGPKPEPLPVPGPGPAPGPSPVPSPAPGPLPVPSPAPGPSPVPGLDDNRNTNGNNGAIKYEGCSLGYDCVAYYLCKNETIVKDGDGLLDIRFDDNTPKQCPFLEGCCAIDDLVTVPITTPKPTPDGCGHRNTDGIGFKITGDSNNEAEYGEFPWMVAILKEDKGLQRILNIYECGGSIIHPQVVLTAAHCVQNKQASALKVRAGEWDTQSKSELYPDQDRNVAEVIVHPHFYKGGLFNDIALLYLTEPFELADNVKTVCLPPKDTQFDYERCFATGWGKNEFSQMGKYQTVLKKIDLPIVPRDQCQASLRTTRLGKYFELHPSFICAGGEKGKDTCKGDGGSPLVCPIPGTVNRYYQAGIVAWGIGCGDEIPGVYASINNLRPWIDETLAYKRIDSSMFTP